jgi:hypothetical protein
MRALSLIVLLAFAARSALAWDCHGHRTITLLALDGFASRSPDMPPWLKPEHARLMVASGSCEPDRWRSIKAPLYLAHENNPDHYLDIDKLDQFGLTLSTIPPLRYEYLRCLIVAKHEHPEGPEPYNPKMDPSRSTEWPGYAPHAVMEAHGKLTSAFKTARTLEKLNDPARAPQLEAARAAAIYTMGVLSHFVGDLAQPLHTTKHHHGWIGENPDGFTVDRKIHAYIDGEILVIHQLDYELLKPGFTAERRVDAADPWRDVLAHIQRSHDRVRDVYAMFKSGDLEKEPGKAMISERLRDGGSMLATLYASAWAASVPDDAAVKDFIKYDAWGSIKDARVRPEARPKP